MARKSERKRAAALEIDPLAYRREAPRGSVEVSVLGNEPYGKEIVLVGRIMLSDNTGEISKLGVFTTLGDQDVIVLEKIEGNGVSVPAYLERTSENIVVANSVVHYGDVVALQGVKMNVMGIDVFIGHKVELLSKAMNDVYDYNIDFRKRSNQSVHRHVQLIQNQEQLRHFRKCSTMFRTVRQFLYREGYDELNLTLLQENFEAGLADPFVTYSVGRDRDMYLRLTSELMLRRLMIAGFSKVFEIGKSFRNQGACSDMLPQFTILELYRAYASGEEMENLVHDMVCEVLLELHGHTSIPSREGNIDCSGEWPSYDFREEIVKCTGMEYDESLPLADLVCLLDKAGIAHPASVNEDTVATALYSHILSRVTGPAFLKNLPAAQSPLFKINNDGSTVDETLLIIKGMLIADLVNPERDPSVIRQRMEKQLKYRGTDQACCINEDFVSAMKFGLPPCRGVGMGMERFFMLMLDKENIRDVELFPVF